MSLQYLYPLDEERQIAHPQCAMLQHQGQTVLKCIEVILATIIATNECCELQAAIRNRHEAIVSYAPCCICGAGWDRKG